MAPRRLIPPLVALAAIGALLATVPAAWAGDSEAAKRRSCGTIKSASVYPYAKVIAIRGVSCKGALRIAKRYDAGRQPERPWRCALAHGDRPRLFSCGSGAGRGDLRNRPHALEAVGTRSR